MFCLLGSDTLQVASDFIASLFWMLSSFYKSKIIRKVFFIKNHQNKFNKKFMYKGPGQLFKSYLFYFYNIGHAGMCI